jgi:mannose-6-phosphate isomerase-like protein (cupin superfamily)
MQKLGRRTFLQLVTSSLPLAALGAAPTASMASPVVIAGQDREGVPPRGRLGRTTFKVLTKETGGGLFVIEQLDRTKAGPDLHLHHEQDEQFYVIEGEYVFEIGTERFRLKSGDSVLGPRGVPHAYLFVGASIGRLLISYAPAGKMEAFFSQSSAARPASADMSPEAIAGRRTAMYADYGMKYLGPPLSE